MRGFYDSSQLHPATLIAFFCMLMVFFGVGYYQGVKSADKEFRTAHDQTLEREQRLVAMLDACEGDFFLLSGKFLLENNVVKTTVIGNSANIEQCVKKAARESEKMDDERDKCRVGTSGTVESGESCVDSEGKHRELLVELRKKPQTTLGLLKKMTEHNEGADGVYGCGLLNSIRHKYKKLCSNLPGCTLLSDDSLLRRWQSALQQSAQQRAEEEVAIMEGLIWQYNSEQPRKQSVVGIWLPEVDEKNKTRPPTFFGRSGNLPLVIGQEEETSQIVVRTVAERLVVLHQLAFCACHYHNPNITVSSLFFVGGGSLNVVPAALHLFVQTPLVTFCVNCTDAVGGNNNNNSGGGGAASMCSGVLQDAAFYGKTGFWLSRSMVPPHAAVLDEAEKYRTEHALHEKKVLAVVLHNSLKDCLARSEQPRGNHFLYLLANFPEEKAHFKTDMINDTVYQCFPTATQFVRRVSQVLDDTVTEGKGRPFGAVYITTSREMWVELEKLENKPSWWQMALFRPKEETTSAREEFVDLVIAGYADGLLLGSFCSSSQYVLESFLLKRELRPEGRVWFF